MVEQLDSARGRPTRASTCSAILKHVALFTRIPLKLYESRNHYQIAITESNLGMVLAMMGERQAGLEMIRSAYHVLVEKLGPEHPITRDAAKKLERFS